MILFVSMSARITAHAFDIFPEQNTCFHIVKLISRCSELGLLNGNAILGSNLGQQEEQRRGAELMGLGSPAVLEDSC